VLSPLVAEVYTIEIVESLGHRAAKVLRDLHYDNVHAKVGDGFKGWAEFAPFDKVIVTCSPENVPRPLVEQLRDGGRMIIPLGERYQQSLYLMKKKGDKLETEALVPTLFVPMTGEAESLRRVLPDGSKPGVFNGSFEDAEGDPPRPRGWHYQRYCERAQVADAPDGQYVMKFTNDVPGRSAQMLQGLACDGHKIKYLKLGAWVQGQGIVAGPADQDLPAFVVTFYNQNRAAITTKWLGPWRGTFKWEYFSGKIAVPPQTRDAIIRIGLHGATGSALYDAIEIVPQEN
ncbi:MAG: protein-L-isoaspartate(D-aspartate) O-methyltransferase, partial [Pirellulales bacterium]|nr:protein-L-isoaspartate(D-aspartate) O-methyltransferase [Pirellulales bacterium]